MINIQAVFLSLKINYWFFSIYLEIGSWFLVLS